MQYYIYITTNLISGKQYIGQHKGELNDSYFGSGTNIMKALEKYGKENFKKEILFIFDNELEMNEKEKELVNESIVNDPQYYNVMLGGDGGDTWSRSGRKHTEETKKKISKSIQKYIQQLDEVGHMYLSDCSKAMWKKIHDNPQQLAEIKVQRSKAAKQYWNNNERKMLIETRKKISDSLKIHYDKIGRKSPIRKSIPYKSINASGKKVKVHLNNEEHTIYECDLQWYLDNGWIRGRNPDNKKPLARTEEAKNNSSGKGKLIVFNLETNEVKRILPDELELYINNGWKRGYPKKLK